MAVVTLAKIIHVSNIRSSTREDVDVEATLAAILGKESTSVSWAASSGWGDGVGPTVFESIAVTNSVHEALVTARVVDVLPNIKDGSVLGTINNWNVVA